MHYVILQAGGSFLHHGPWKRIGCHENLHGPQKQMRCLKIWKVHLLRLPHLVYQTQTKGDFATSVLCQTPGDKFRPVAYIRVKRCSALNPATLLLTEDDGEPHDLTLISLTFLDQMLTSCCSLMALGKPICCQTIWNCFFRKITITLQYSAQAVELVVLTEGKLPFLRETCCESCTCFCSLECHHVASRLVCNEMLCSHIQFWLHFLRKCFQQQH